MNHKMGFLLLTLLVAITSSQFLPIYAVAGHGLLGSGLAGVALLKLKAAAAVGVLLALKGGHAGFHITVPRGHFRHGGGNGGGWGWRGKRSTDEIGQSGQEGQGVEKPSINTSKTKYDPTLDEVLANDPLGCGLRLLCELNSVPSSALQEDEKLILGLFGPDVKAPNPTKSSRGKLSYFYARILGKSSKNSHVCSKVYGKCPYNRKAIMQFLREANI